VDTPPIELSGAASLWRLQRVCARRTTRCGDPGGQFAPGFGVGLRGSLRDRRTNPEDSLCRIWPLIVSKLVVAAVH
jgi:hypothetical protein